MSETEELPPVHLTIDNLEKIEDILRGNTTNCETEIVLSLPGGVEQKFNSAGEINDEILADVGGSKAYSIYASGEEGQCTLAGESTKSESHILYCAGESEWGDKIQYEVKKYYAKVQTTKSRLRGHLKGIVATGLTVLAALFVGWAVTAISPQSVVHYYPSLSDAVVFSLGIFGLSIVRFRNWVHPYIWIGQDRPYPSERRFLGLGLAAILLTVAILIFRSWMEPGPFLR